MERDIIAKRIARLNLYCDIFAQNVLDDKATVEYLLRNILGTDDLFVDNTEVQHRLASVENHSAVLDVWAHDSSGTYYDIEIQQSSDGAIPERARYYSSLIDSTLLDKGESYDMLPETYVIFFAREDVLVGDKQIYHIERVVKETQEPFNDREHIIYINGASRDISNELGRIIHDFRCADVRDFLTQPLKQRVAYYKEPDEGGYEKMSDIMDQFRAEDARNTALKLAISFGFSAAQIAEVVSFDEETVAQWLAEAAENEDTKK